VTAPPFQSFFDAHRREVYRFLAGMVGREEAEDCFQETFLAALRGYPPAGSRPNLRAWVLTIAQRKAIDAQRSRARRPRTGADEAILDSAADGRPQRSAPDPATAVEAAEPEVWAAVRELAPKQRAALVLRYALDLSHREVAGVLDCSEEAARRSAHEGLKRLREVMT
jgi:RNA polymerase sigma factor (sigma-70 family)